MVVDAWTRLGAAMMEHSLEANRAIFSAFATEPTQTDQPPGNTAVAFDRDDWTFDRSVEEAAAITVGDTVTFSKVLDEEDVRVFSSVSGDSSHLHLDAEYAAETRFGERIVHGTLAAGLISAALARLPGCTIYLSQDLEFLAPVRIGARVSATVEVVEALGADQYRLSTTVVDEETTVLDGEAVVLIDEQPAP
ncbi:MaoC family dehydratase [Natronococcus wangiae]|uniref:MaoC family dehydratase n=1 Tax=Natronococcus wangiae TaxID=3068275 RepID=UPI00273FB99B|nr:MaoC family dehydratase [Natronococcus sp. AD5]